MKIFLLTITLCLTLFLAACNDDDDAMRPANEVWMDNTSFIPEILSVTVETTVTWVNNSSVTHTVTSEDGLFDSFLPAGESFSYTFTIPGTYVYRCTLHPGMTASIMVQ